MAATTTALNSTSNADSTWHTDALQAVKLDPAVLEAQITVEKSKSKVPSSEQEHLASIPENPAEKTKIKELSETERFEEMVQLQKAALLSLAPHQFELLLNYAGVLRRQRYRKQKHLECAFCKNNGEPVSWYSTHSLKDSHGRVRCPVLRGYRCPTCGATGDFAHTIKYCPENLDGDLWSR